jgi:hypothetical protein
VNIGNYKGVMLCNRPFAGVAGKPGLALLLKHPSNSSSTVAAKNATKPSAFLTGTASDSIGANVPIMKDKAFTGSRSKKHTALSRHKKWLADLQKTKDELEGQMVEDQEAKEDRHARFMERERKMRAAVRGIDAGDDAKYADEYEGGGNNAPQKAEGKKGGSKKPMWAMTEGKAEVQADLDDDEEAEELLDFASGLDFDKFIDDMEVRAMMEQVKGRVDDLESAIADEEAAEKLAEARATARENGGELDDDMLQSLGLTQEQLDKWNEDLGGEETSRPEEDDIISIAETLLAEGTTGNVHSKASMQKKVASVRAQLDTARSEPERTKFVAPKIVTHKEDLGARLKKKDDVSNLPYMHRNPAV